MQNLGINLYTNEINISDYKKAYNILLSEFSLSLYKELTNSSCGIL